MLNSRPSKADEELFRELEEADDDHLMAAMRERRMAELRYQAALPATVSHGSYDLIKLEKSLMKITTETEKCIVHFSHADFKRCRTMDAHLEKLARKHRGTKFMKIMVENAPFLVEKMKIQVLPCIMAFINGVGCDQYSRVDLGTLLRLIGFEGVAEGDAFPTSALEERLAASGIL